ncbi:MAG: D,D-heptose 1,7-bisphosphate phosphatase [Desulfobulbaceae bacterium A2]|nr:MAG: D,D-heptose 1,7-bisphosphate phosphatase [Desulfobulbaceae bacterium A2]
MTHELTPAVFLDRDGTINEQMGYINHISRFHLLPEAAAGIRLLNEAQVPVVVVSNQSGLARGYFPPALLDEVHALMHKLLAQAGAHVDAVYFCPHHPEAVNEEFRQKCDCRKPRPGMLHRAAADLQLDLTRSFVVGDRWSDLKCAVNVGASPVLVLTGYGRGDLVWIGPQQQVQPEYVAENLLQAARWILARMALNR